MKEKIIIIDNTSKIPMLFGELDSNISVIEFEYNVTIIYTTEEKIKITGENAEDIEKASSVIEYLSKFLSYNPAISEQNIRYAICMINDGKEGELFKFDGDCICITAKGKPIKAKTIGQKAYVDAIKKHTITIGIGPAGTGKTFLAVAMAVTALKNKTVSKIILTRPAVEAGEKLGFLPGDLQSKVDPYLRPLYDALHEMLGFDGFQKYTERGIIEIAPLAYMRGRTLEDSFIILDEAQNTTPEQMKMFLTRLGFNSKAIVNGDVTQIDLLGGQSGLVEATKVLPNIDDIAIHEFTEKDVVRHKLVQKIILAYEKHETKRIFSQNAAKEVRFDKDRLKKFKVRKENPNGRY